MTVPATVSVDSVASSVESMDTSKSSMQPVNIIYIYIYIYTMVAAVTPMD